MSAAAPALVERHPFRGGVFRAECFETDATIQHLQDQLTIAREIGDELGLRRLDAALNAYLDCLPRKWVEETHNLVTNAGLTYVTGAGFLSVTQITSWFVGLINNSPSPTLAAADTAASHSGWSELTGYSESTRQGWTGVAGSAGAATNAASRAVFTANATATIAGAFLISNSTKGGTTGTLACEALFSATQPVVSTNVVRVTYALAATDDGV